MLQRMLLCESLGGHYRQTLLSAPRDPQPQARGRSPSRWTSERDCPQRSKGERKPMKRLAIAVLVVLACSSAKAQTCAPQVGAIEEVDGFSGSAVIPGSISSIFSQGSGIIGYQNLLANATYGFA